MPHFYDQLKEAQLENVAGDKATLSLGLVWLDTVTKKAKYYDGVTIRSMATGSGGGGGSLTWRADDTGNGALDIIEYYQKVWKFSQGLSQKIFTVIKVPTAYSAGDQINMRANIYTPDTSGTALIQSIATLIRVGTDAFSSLSNQRTSTNAAISLSGSADLSRAVTLDLTSSTGTINSVAVSAGDLIKVQLQRASDTASNEVRFVESSVEMTFS